MIDGINAMIPIAHVTLVDRDYNCFISMSTITRNIHVFKYNESACEYEVFPSQYEAETWINQNLKKQF